MCLDTPTNVPYSSHRLAHCSAGMPEGNSAQLQYLSNINEEPVVQGDGTIYPQEGWLQMHRAECGSADALSATSAKGCWCTESDWLNPLDLSSYYLDYDRDYAEDYSFRLWGEIPYEWFTGEKTDAVSADSLSCDTYSQFGYDPSLRSTNKINKYALWDQVGSDYATATSGSSYYVDEYGYINEKRNRYHVFIECDPQKGGTPPTFSSGTPKSDWRNTLMSVCVNDVLNNVVPKLSHTPICHIMLCMWLLCSIMCLIAHIPDVMC